VIRDANSNSTISATAKFTGYTTTLGNVRTRNPKSKLFFQKAIIVLPNQEVNTTLLTTATCVKQERERWSVQTSTFKIEISVPKQTKLASGQVRIEYFSVRKKNINVCAEN
jgi:hypothetical protein